MICRSPLSVRQDNSATCTTRKPLFHDLYGSYESCQAIHGSYLFDSIGQACCFLSFFNFRLAKSTKDWTGKQIYKAYKVIRLTKGLEMPKSRGTQIPSDMGTPLLYICLLSFFNFRLAKSTKDWTGKQNYKAYKVIRLTKGLEMPNSRGYPNP